MGNRQIQDPILLDGIQAFERHLQTLPEFRNIEFIGWTQENGNIQANVSRDGINRGLVFNQMTFIDVISQFNLPLNGTHNNEQIREDRRELIDEALNQIRNVLASSLDGT